MKPKYLLLVASCLLLTACASQKQSGDAVTPTSTQMAARKQVTKSINYSNLLDSQMQTEVKSVLEQAFPQENVTKFLEQVNFYNQHVPTDSLVQTGFGTSKELIPAYDVVAISEKWMAQFPDFPGYNCRLTSFGLLRGLITTKSTTGYDDSLLFIDKDAIQHAPASYQLTAEEASRFQTIFSAVATENVTDTHLHVKKVQAYWKKMGVTFETGQAKMISVWMHDQIDEKKTKLFIGHVGVLVPSETEFLFVEKISFEEPYQVLRFKSKKALVGYLLDKYDVDTTGGTRPFLMENDQPLEE
ncbi:DUF4300 family protein [Streptococcus gallinaceus]|uniref:DUF4300 domain-containing protein n=1 Tax=Streptococcus gallinaceus TaxID=165758 RepID=A0ABV2JHR5_9STRE